MDQLTPTESDEARAIADWVQWKRARYPELRLLYHIPNEGYRSYATVAYMKARGALTKGLLDYHLPIARGGFIGLWVELKRLGGGVVSAEQTWWIKQLREQGHCVEVCRGAKAAVEVIEKYLRLDK